MTKTSSNKTSNTNLTATHMAYSNKIDELTITFPTITFPSGVYHDKCKLIPLNCEFYENCVKVYRAKAIPPEYSFVSDFNDEHLFFAYQNCSTCEHSVIKRINDCVSIKLTVTPTEDIEMLLPL